MSERENIRQPSFLFKLSYEHVLYLAPLLVLLPFYEEQDQSFLTEFVQNKTRKVLKMTMMKKGTWKCIILSCYKTEPLPESENQALTHSSFRRLSLSDVNNPSSPLSVEDLSNSFAGPKLHIFTFAELRVITQSFSRNNLLGEGGFGPVYKGFIDDKLRPGLEAQPVAVKSLDLDGMQGHNEWMVSSTNQT